MPLILNIETATTVCSVALTKSGQTIAVKEMNDGYSHSENLTLFIEAIFREINLPISSLDAIAVSKGPGSYTGLRIGVSTAKGLCFALNKPLIAINTLQAMAINIVELFSANEQILFCPMLDARRMEVYCAFYDNKNAETIKTKAIILHQESFIEMLNNNKIVFFGNGAIKCKQILTQHQNALFVDNIFPSAKNMAKLTEQAFLLGQFQPLAYFEPYYLKDFISQ